jgi:amino acid adenylation domain-containing protein
MNPGDLHAGSPLLVHELVKTQITRQPTRIAIRFGSQQLTYQQLDQKASRIAWLLNKNCQDEQIIGISTTRTIDMIAGVLGILRSGRAYLPIDPTYPPDRLSQIIKESAVKSCLASGKDHNVLLNTGIKIISSGMDGHVAEYSSQNSFGSGMPLAYILYTSGSTGKPKGVSMGHAALVNLLKWQSGESKAGPGTNTLQFAPLSFDVSFQEIFSTLSTGGTLVLAGDDIRLDPFRLLELIKEEAINRIFLPFVALQQLAETAGTNNYFPSCLQEVITAGEQLKITPQLIKLFSGIPECKLFNQYGPTEAHVVTQLLLEGDPLHWPALPGIGRPISNAQIFIIDEHKLLLEAGETGELIIGGSCLAEGYLNQPGLTAGKFFEWQHPAKGKMRMYRTGDLARYGPGGNLEFLGRMDDQVKIRGHRVEPGEIEVMLNKYPDVEQAVVIARENKSGQKRLLAYFKPGNARINVNAVRAYLENSLPQYMVPSAIIGVQQFPKTTSGKIDKNALPGIEIKRPDLDTVYLPPATDSERKIAGVWASLLEMDRTGTMDNFFELGGNSLLAIKTIVELREKYDLELPVTRLYSHPTIKELANFLDHGDTLDQEKNIQQVLPTHDIAVIGLAGRFPGAGNVEVFWQNLVDGKETTSFFSSEELDPSVPDELRNNPAYVKARGILNDADMFDASFFGINPNLASLMDPQQRLFLEISWELLEKTGYLPAHYKGSIGVFAGSGNNTYYFNNVQHNPGLVDQVGAFQVMTANEKDYIATRTAFQLNLKGPAISLNTGCSTSLLAISQAVENIRAGRCDMAIAGGVAVTVPLKSGHLYEEGAMLSREGHCRPFDTMAGGTVFSDGAGVVLLKKLNEAVADGDTIYGIIKGIGVNNDGANKNSFTAPSASGQAAAIKQAINEAGIDAAEIGYIEAHGTATPIGDPIEIEGLKMAFGLQSAKQYCAIGSVKGNLGHLTAAAGVTGFIKTVLTLYHQQVPASINFNSSNPQIDFENSPFYVNTTLRSWTTDKRIAGVSSFGVGGTNVHIIMESADAMASCSPDPKPAQLLQFSAKSVESLKNYSDKLADLINHKEGVSLQDVAFSLRSTRQQFNQRRFVVAGDCKTAISKLQSPASQGEQILNRNAFDQVVFVFPGQGSQFVNMGKELYKQEPIFRDAVDECAFLLYEFMKEDIRTILFDDTTINKSHLINNTRYTQPAMFIYEYALAKLWMNWGIKPSALIGHSIGEFVAAHLSGIFSLGDAIRLIETRGRLMAELPQGSMISVLAGIEQVMKLIPVGLSVAAINSRKMTVVAGPADDIDFFSIKLNEAGIGNKKLVTSHAFHSDMMQPVKLPFEKLVTSITINKPTIPIYSTVTGKLLSDSEAIDPEYWSNHLVATVRFADAVEELLSRAPTAFLEIGPRNVTTTLVKQQAGDRQVLAIASQRQESNGHHHYAEILEAVGQLWINGISIDFSKLTNKSNACRIDLPSYAFDKKKHWVNGRVKNQTQISGSCEVRPGTMGKPSYIIAIRKILGEASGFDMSDFPVSTSFIEGGLDSLLLTQIALTLKKQFPVPVSFRQLNEECNTIEKLANYYTGKNMQFAEMPSQDIQDCNIANSHVQPQAQSDQEQPYGQNAGQPVNDKAALDMILQQLRLLSQQVAQLQANQTISSAGESFAKIIKPENAFLQSKDPSNNVPESYRIENEPPVPGAKLGKDNIGNPAWFISNPAKPGGYLQIQKN